MSVAVPRLMRAPKHILPLADYQRIFRLIYTVLEDRAHTHRACIFFAIAGAAILQHSYKLKAVPISGAAAFGVNDDDRLVATFGRMVDDELVSDPEAFHCWVQCDGFAMDFMAPIFQENMAGSGHRNVVARRMFQRPLATMASSVFQIKREGDFFLVPDRERTQSMFVSFNARLASADLVNICLEWYRRPPKRMDDSLLMKDDTGALTTLKLHGPTIVGVW